LWKNLKRFGVSPTCTNLCDEDPDSLNRKFLSHNSSNVVPLPSSFNQINQTSFRNSRKFSFYFGSILTHIKSNSAGVDGICLKFLKLCADFVLHPLCHIINSAFTLSTFPDAWKQAKVIPVYKSQNEFRPISILPLLLKIIEKIMLLQISKFVNEENLLNIYQSGFRSGHSCTTALLKIINDIGEAIIKDKVSIYISLDFSKAFDSIDHFILCCKLL